MSATRSQSPEPDGSPPWGRENPSLQAIRDLTRVSARLHHVISRRSGLSPADLSALDLLSNRVMGPAELARALDLTTAAATGIVDRLESRGHVERRPIPGDRRRKGVHITEAGRHDARGHLQQMIDGLQANDAAFTDAEREVVRRYLTGATEAMRSVLEDPEGD